MKKLYFLLITLCLFTDVNAQIINFTDANLRTKLLSASVSNGIAKNLAGQSTAVDRNFNGEIEVSEALNISSLILTNSSLTDLTSLNSYFPNLKRLYIGNNQLATINLSNLANLEYLDCGVNLLTTFDFTGLINLQTFLCRSNQITVFNNLLSSPNLQNIDCANNRFSTLNLNGLANLDILDCSNNQITSINFSGVNLSDLRCGANQFTSLDVSLHSNLRIFYCGNNPLLTTINISGLDNLEDFNCRNCQVTSINFSGLSAIRTFTCATNRITNLDFSGCPSLENLYCSGNLLTSLNFGLLDNLQYVECSYNQLTTIDLSGCSRVFNMLCNNNRLVSLFLKNGIYGPANFSNNYNLRYICADENELASIENSIISYGIPNCHVNTYCTFVSGGLFYTVQGNNRYDADNNGCSAADIPVSNLNFSLVNGVGSTTIVSNASGVYSIPVQAGATTITPVLENPTYFSVSPTNVAVNFPSQASPFTQNFCITANGVHPDLEISILPIVPARPGFDAVYKLICKNKGTNVQSGTLNLAFDDAILDFVSANPILSNQSLNVLSWNFTNLQPFETREITFTLNLNSTTETPVVNDGDVLNYTASITSAATDETPVDNTFTLNQTVVNSYDPNDKTCLEGATIAPSEVGKYVHYMIRFENTGTFPAENIVVKDMIDTAKFDVNSLVPIKGSHPFVTNITSGNKVEFIFENINLPFDDASNDGYVVFKIKTKPTLVTGNTFSNSASIYFDYNFPIVTNTATTTIQTLSSQDFSFGTYFMLYPNPVSDVLNIETKQTIEVSSVSIYNQLGQLILVVPNAQNVSKVDVSSLSSGNYFIKINSDKGTSNTKFIKL